MNLPPQLRVDPRVGMRALFLAVRDGAVSVDDAMGALVIDDGSQDEAVPTYDRDPLNLLSKREFNVFCLLAEGKSLKRIAQDWGISFKTVSTYRLRAITKLKLRTNADIVRAALRMGIIQ